MSQAGLKYKLANKSRGIDSQLFDVSDCLCIGAWPYDKDVSLISW